MRVLVILAINLKSNLVKNTIIALILSLISAGCYSQPKIKKVEVLCVSPSIHTVMKIDCESFKSVFKEKVNVTNLDKNDIRKMETYLTKWTSSKNLEPDVRAQFIIHNTDGSIKVLCYDGGYILSMNGHDGKVSTSFAYFLNSIICR